MVASQNSANDKADSGDRSQEAVAISFRELAAGAREVLIEHAGQVYRLRLTKNGKLILNK